MHGWHRVRNPAVWRSTRLLFLGLLAFAATEIGLGERYGALIMGVGVLLGAGTMAHRLLEEEPSDHQPAG